MSALILPWPSRDLHPNARVHWARRAKATKAARQLAWAEALKAKWVAPDSARIYLQIYFYPPDKRQRDLDGLLSSIKATIDGIADAIGVDDRLFVPLLHAMEQPRHGGQVHIRIMGDPNT